MRGSLDEPRIFPAIKPSSRSSYLENMDEPTAHIRELLQGGYRYALSLTHHHYEAEDLVQEAWLRVWRKYGECSTRALLLSAVRNRFVDGVGCIPPRF